MQTFNNPRILQETVSQLLTIPSEELLYFVCSRPVICQLNLLPSKSYIRKGKEQKYLL